MLESIPVCILCFLVFLQYWQDGCQHPFVHSPAKLKSTFIVVLGRQVFFVCVHFFPVTVQALLFNLTETTAQ